MSSILLYSMFVCHWYLCCLFCFCHTQITTKPFATTILYCQSFSDHIAISLLLDDKIRCTIPSSSRVDGDGGRDHNGGLILDMNDGPTKKSQPHKSQRSISSFFKKHDNTATTATMNTAAHRPKKTVPPPATKKRKISNYFATNAAATTAKLTNESKMGTTTTTHKKKTDSSKIKAKAKLTGSIATFFNRHVWILFIAHGTER